MDDASTLLTHGADELARLVRAGAVSSVELVVACLERIARLGPELNAFRAVLADTALERARLADRRRRAGDVLGPLHGVPIAVKDNIDVAGAVTTAGTALLGGNVAGSDARVVERLQGAGAIVLGKLHLAEWAIGGTTHNLSYGPARNPWSTDRSPGGSSGGSAAAVCADLVPAALGTDTGGSLRVPAALTGTTTVRPTRGLVSTRGVVPVSWTFDVVGPLARRARDVRLVLSAIAGYDRDDPGSRSPSGDGGAGRAEVTLEGLRVGLLGDEWRAHVQPGVLAAVDGAAERLSELGALVLPAALPGLAEAGEQAARIMLAEAAAVHAGRLREQPEAFAPDVLARLQYGASVTAAEYGIARHAGRRWRRALETALLHHDVLLAPACPSTAPLLAGTDPLEATRELMRLAAGLSLADVPIAVAPCGFDDGLPVAFQLIGPDWHEPLLLDVIEAFQRVTDWHLRRPSQ